MIYRPAVRHQPDISYADRCAWAMSPRLVKLCGINWAHVYNYTYTYIDSVPSRCLADDVSTVCFAREAGLSSTVACSPRLLHCALGTLPPKGIA